MKTYNWNNEKIFLTQVNKKYGQMDKDPISKKGDLKFAKKQISF
jgi:hypothetical protein